MSRKTERRYPLQGNALQYEWSGREDSKPRPSRASKSVRSIAQRPVEGLLSGGTEACQAKRPPAMARLCRALPGVDGPTSVVAYSVPAAPRSRPNRCQGKGGGGSDILNRLRAGRVRGRGALPRVRVVPGRAGKRWAGLRGVRQAEAAAAGPAAAQAQAGRSRVLIASLFWRAFSSQLRAGCAPETRQKRARNLPIGRFLARDRNSNSTRLTEFGGEKNRKRAGEKSQAICGIESGDF
jgi:hypothetical protein